MNLLHAIGNCDTNVPNRSSKLIDEYLKLKPTTEDEVSIEIEAGLERIKEINVDDYDSNKKSQVLQQLIAKYSISQLKVPIDSSKIYLVTSITNCNLCKAASCLIVNKPGRKGISAVLYTETGPRWIEAYHKTCPSCSAVYYSSYSEYQNMRRYYGEKLRYFSVTQETFFETSLLDVLTEDLFLCETRFTNFCSKYNKLYIKQDAPPLHKNRLIHCWEIYAISKRIPVVFPIHRKSDRNLDFEKIFEYLYPALKNCIDTKWLCHRCTKCSSRLVVLDGDAKAFRSVCAAKGSKIVTKGKLNEFTACASSPLTGKLYCDQHMGEKMGESIERLDTRMTRARRRQLGLDVDELTTEFECREKEDITVRKTRARTAGMMYAYRTCGISLGHLESIHAETCTDFMILLIETFGDKPDDDSLSGVVIDRACGVHPYALKLGQEGHAVCAHYASKHWMVDPFHIKGHVVSMIYLKFCLELD